MGARIGAADGVRGGGLGGLLAPRSVALTGASTPPNSISRRALDGLRRFGSDGALVTVDPSVDGPLVRLTSEGSMP